MLRCAALPTSLSHALTHVGPSLSPKGGEGPALAGEEWEGGNGPLGPYFSGGAMWYHPAALVLGGRDVIGAWLVCLVVAALCFGAG